MLLKILEMSFILCSIILFSSIIIFKLFIKNTKNNDLLSNYVATMTFFLLFYVLLCLIIALVSPSICQKAIMLLFALSPFIIGKYATFKTEKIFTGIQSLTIIISILYVVF